MERKREMPLPGIRYTLLASAIVCVAVGSWCLYLARTTPGLLLCGIVVLLLAVGLLVCLYALRKAFRALDDLEDAVEGWSCTSPEALEQIMKSLDAPAEKLGSTFYDKMREMEENLARVEEKARAKAEHSAEQRIVRQVRDRLLPRVMEDYPNRKYFEIAGIAEDAAHPGSTYYDYFFIDPGMFCVSVAQLSQNGVPELLQPDDAPRAAVGRTVFAGRLVGGKRQTF